MSSNPPPAAKKEMVDHPDHYGGKHNPYEVIKVIEAWGLDFHEGNAVKYIGRGKRKANRVQDLEKAVWYLQRQIHLLKIEDLTKRIKDGLIDEEALEEKLSKAFTLEEKIKVLTAYAEQMEPREIRHPQT